MKKLSEDRLKQNIINISKSNTPDLWDKISKEIDKKSDSLCSDDTNLTITDKYSDLDKYTTSVDYSNGDTKSTTNTNSSDMPNTVSISSKNSRPINSNKRKSLNSKYVKVFSGVAAMVILALGIGFISNIIAEKSSDLALSTKDIENSMDDNSNTSLDDSSKPVDKSPVNYNKLNFAPLADLSDTSKNDSTNIEFGGESLCIVSFSEDILNDISIMSKVTLLDIYFKDYKYDTYSDKFEPNGRLHQWDRTVVYEVRIDELYYNECDVKVGDVIKIEDRSFNGWHSTKESLLNLKVNRQYILPLYYAGETILYSLDDFATGDITRDGNYGIAYQFAPQIEVTLDNEYLFHSGWQSLINDKTVDVVMDSETSVENFYNDKMKLRRDDKFIEDLKSLIEKHR
ncbi:MAG: hypothetical protein RR636_09255 [Clostridium sp.]|uniref:hypothetical protein n=1 Tax=Clostridium sp. TaxID=1506 RepID=UPI00321792E5